MLPRGWGSTVAHSVNIRRSDVHGARIRPGGLNMLQQHYWRIFWWLFAIGTGVASWGTRVERMPLRDTAVVNDRLRKVSPLIERSSPDSLEDIVKNICCLQTSI